jgi:hypothetical protein
MCHDGTGLRCERTEVRFGRVRAGSRPTLTPRSGSTRIRAPWKTDRSVLASPFRSWSLDDAQHTRRSGSKGGSGRWSHWDDIGWVHYPEIGWSHSDEIRWVQSLEILQGLPESPRLKELLDRDLEPLRGEALKRHDGTLDSIFCAYLAWHCWRWGEERNQMFGTLEHGYIVVPKAEGAGRQEMGRPS